jgi:plasmid stability protein
MKQLTLRDIPDDLEREIRRIARERGTSINKTVRQLLCESLGIDQSSGKKRDLSEFAGFWNKKEAEEFDKATEVFEKVDEELWK